MSDKTSHRKLRECVSESQIAKQKRDSTSENEQEKREKRQKWPIRKREKKNERIDEERRMGSRLGEISMI